MAENFNSINNNHKAYLNNKVENSFFLHFATEYEITKEINNMDCKKSPGYDEISVKFLQVAKNLIAKPLMLIFNKAITTGQYPDALKIAKVIPLFKKGESNLLSNYRPISLLSLLNKIFEKLLYRRLYCTFMWLKYNDRPIQRSTVVILPLSTMNPVTRINNQHRLIHNCGCLHYLTL